MSEITGVVTSRNPKGTGIQVGGAPEWYMGKGDVLTDAIPGAEVKLKYENKANYKWVTDVEIVTKAKTTSATTQATAENKVQTKKQTGYEKAQDDRQRVIVYQAARNAAIEMAKVAAQSDALALPAKKADKFDALAAFVDELTVKFFDEAMNKYNGEK